MSATVSLSPLSFEVSFPSSSTGLSSMAGGKSSASGGKCAVSAMDFKCGMKGALAVLKCSQSMPLKNGCALISVAPPLLPSLSLTSHNSERMKCSATGLKTKNFPSLLLALSFAEGNRKYSLQCSILR